MTELLSEEQILRDNGYNPETFELVRSISNEWGFDDRKATQTKITVRKKVLDELVLPAAIDGKSFKQPKPLPKRKTYSVVFLADQHVPFADPDLHQAVLNLLADIEPARVVLLGDLLDFDAISRHQKEPDLSATLQATIDGGYELVREYREAAPQAQFDFLTGNHDERLRKFIINQAADLYGLKQAQSATAVHSLDYLLRFDELKINAVPFVGSYINAELEILPGFVAVHGQYIRKQSGASVAQHLARSGKSTVMGHCHRLASVYHAAYGDSQKTLVGVEAGYLAKPELGHYAGLYPDWTQGLAVAEVSAMTNAFHLTAIPYLDGELQV